MGTVTELKFGECILVNHQAYTIEGVPGAVVSDKDDGRSIFAIPPTLPTDVSYKEIINSSVYVYVSSSLGDYPFFGIFSKEWKPSDVISYFNLPSTGFYVYGIDNKLSETFPSWVCSDNIEINRLKKLIDYGIEIALEDCEIWTPNSDYGPYIYLELGDNVGISATPLYPTSDATISKSLPTTFQWSTAPTSENTLSPVSMESCSLRWRYLGDSNINVVPLSAANECTIPAGTFESGTIEWQVSVSANSGTTNFSPWVTVQVSEPLSSARALFPKNTIVDGASPITFAWEHIISNGTAPSGFDLQVSRNQSDWDLLLTQQLAASTAEVPGNTFTSGDLYWRIRTYNLDGVAGEWSETAHCIVIAAPAAPAVTATESVPRFSIRWHQFDQQGYEIKLNDNVICRRYGSQATYTHDQYLDPGTYSVKVRIQNQYGLWSGWGEMILAVANEEEHPISLSASADNHVTHLVWETTGNYDAYLIYRNGTAIAKINGREYTDQFAAGHTTYQVRGIYNNSGLCGTSPKCDLFVEIKKMVISDVSSPNWIELEKSVSSLRSIQLSRSCSSTYNHFIGSALPSADIGEAEYRSFELDCAWKNTDLTQALAFESLVGKIVFIKTTTRNSVVAVMDSFQKEENRFWTSYRAYLTPVDWEEEIR